ncbi:HAMP domain-containing histidine kinase [Clostridium sp. CM028]|uniref:HAMP domain-containing sensor histidine kinase n=1 Tax=unclassified Clostridium TaxID=2614128 RepID=UPI001C6EDA09|nr:MULTISPECIES: HAMP domain-containing sensor histidine kinase [unclassified Clostridium]MBW9144371.1 HAMP domain-containing histidine kinase [Clostridium sp. CM027]MBW9149391.1 HAMP domain-containing histidine kinase [Clostridium sp. CM028]UVE41000.1 HAMP domain-containing histidine kinase [Clostridium sp. CM027]WLC61666.1 HAMP domain-containing histidine kinase [Clostridium sp. CM028]
MKRIVKLKGELVIIALIAFVISFLSSAMIKDKGVGIYNKNPTLRINNIYDKCIPNLEKELKNSNLSNNIALKQLINDKYSYNQGYSFYIVDQRGNVIVQNSKGVQVIDKNELKDGKREYSVPSKYKKDFRVSGCEYLKDGYFLYYVYLGYGNGDSMMMLWALIGFVIIFFILVWGRVSYISKMKFSVQIIAKGNLSHRVPIHYNNELRELAEGINFMASELEKEDRKRSEFLTNISHDLRTPLTTILGYIDILKKDKYNSKEELSKYISIIERKGVYLRTMLEDFFQYSKLTSKDIILNFENLELNELGRQIFEDEASGFDENSLKLEVELSKEPVYINGDPDLIGRAVNNIISNALKYSKINTVVKIKIFKEELNSISYGVFCVSNVPRETVSEAEVDSFFERLYKKDKSRHEEGSGLGLSIVKDIVKLHEGIIKGFKEKEEVVFKLFIK